MSRLDNKANTVTGIKILGRESANGRIYPPRTISKAKGLYEGAKVNVDHSKNNDRSYGDRFGAIFNVREATDGLYGDLKYNPEHPRAKQFEWDVENLPGNAGFSHTIQAEANRKDGVLVVEEITSVISVDLVADPATTRGFFEDKENNMNEEKDAPVLTLELLKRDHFEVYEEAQRKWAADYKPEGEVIKESELNRLEESNRTLEAKVLKLEHELTQERTEKAELEYRKRVDIMLAEANLSRPLMTQTFVETCYEVGHDEAKVKRLIEDRKIQDTGGPMSREQLLVYAGAGSVRGDSSPDGFLSRLKSR